MMFVQLHTPRLLTLATLVMLTTASAARADKVDEYLTREMARNHIAGLSVAVVRDGQVVKLQAYGTANLEWNAPTTVDTAFPLASATKPITGTVLMRLAQAGTIDLDATVSRYLADAPAAWADVTIRHLATHSSGIPDDLGQPPPRTAAEVSKLAMSLPLTHAPGTRASYGVIGYAVLQHVIETVAGRPFADVVDEHLLVPLGMHHTGFDHASDDGPGRTSELVRERAGVYEWTGTSQRNFAFLFGANSYTAGGLLASARDLARWAVALDRDELMTAVRRDALWAASPEPGRATSFGIGWVAGEYRGRRTAGHSGGPALADILRFVDDRLTIIVLANQQRMYPYLAQGVADVYVPAPTLIDAAVPDDAPAITARVRTLLLGFGEGRVDADVFASSARGPLTGAIEQFAMPLFRALGPVSSLVLLEDTRDGDARVRRYRAWYGAKPVLWRFTFDADGLVSSMEPVPE